MAGNPHGPASHPRSEEHTSELQSLRSTLFPYTTLFRSIGKGTSCEFNRSIYGRAQWLVSREWRGIRMGLRPTHRNEKPFFVCHPERRVRSSWRPDEESKEPYGRQLSRPGCCAGRRRPCFLAGIGVLRLPLTAFGVAQDDRQKSISPESAEDDRPNPLGK